MRLLPAFLFVASLLAAAPLGAQPATAPAPPAGAGTAQVKAGDQVSVRIDREPEMSGTYNVSTDGSVVLPRLGTVPVAGRSAVALEEELRAAYGRYLRNPGIEVRVLRRVSVQGDVARPGLFWVDLTTTLPELVALAGGVTDQGDRNRIEIVREGQRFQVRGNDVAVFAAAELSSGDQVVVGRRSWLSRNPNVAIGTFTGLVSMFIGIVQLIR